MSFKVILPQGFISTSADESLRIVNIILEKAFNLVVLAIMSLEVSGHFAKVEAVRAFLNFMVIFRLLPAFMSMTFNVFRKILMIAILTFNFEKIHYS